MVLQGKSIIVTSNSSVFLKLTKLFIENSGNTRNDFIVIAENGLPFKERYRKRIKKVGFLATFDEWLYTRYEALFNHWGKAEKKLLGEVDFSLFKPDILTDSVNKSCNNILHRLKSYEANSIISIGSGYIPSAFLEQFKVKLNIHPGILPEYKGIGTPEAIMRRDFSLLGWSIHELTTKIDSGSILCSYIISYSELAKMTFACIYISLYKSALTNFYSIPNQIDENQINLNGGNKYFAFVRFSQFLKYRIYNCEKI